MICDDNRTHLENDISLLQTGLLANETLVVDLFDEETATQNDSKLILLLAFCQRDRQYITGRWQFDSPADQKVHERTTFPQDFHRCCIIHIF